MRKFSTKRLFQSLYFNLCISISINYGQYSVETPNSIYQFTKPNFNLTSHVYGIGLGHSVDRVKERIQPSLLTLLNTSFANNLSWFIFQNIPLPDDIMYMLHSNLDLHFKYRITQSRWDFRDNSLNLLLSVWFPATVNLLLSVWFPATVNLLLSVWFPATVNFYSLYGSQQL